MEQHPLKLLVITMMYEPDCVGIAAIASDMCAALAERGHDVTVFTTYPYYPEWKLKAQGNRWRVQEEFINDVRVRRHRIFIPANPSNLLSRLIHELSFPVSLLRSMFYGKQYDVVMVYCPLMGGMVFAALRKLFSRDPLWVNIQDIPVEAAAASGIMKSRWFARFASVVQRLVFNRANVWSSISPEMVEQLETINRSHRPVHLCPNWLTGSLSNQVRQLESENGRVPQRIPKLLYCGTIGKKQGLLQFCEQLSKSDGEFIFQIRGEGSEAEAVRQWVASGGDRRFEFDTLVSPPDFARIIHAADWFVIPQKSSIGCSFFPSKLIPSIVIGTPILAISENNGPLSHEISENGLGLVVPWSQVDSLTEQLDAFRQSPERYKKLRANCLQRALAFDRELAIDRFEELLHEHSARYNQRGERSLFQMRSNGRVPTA